jgi:hypothetical protein
MASEQLLESTKFSVNQLALVNKNGEVIDISNFYAEMSFFDSMFVPVMSGTITMTDAIGLSEEFSFDGSEVLLVDISKFDNSGITDFRKAFRIRKMTNRTNINQSTLMYTLHFVSDELIYSDQRKVNQKYIGTYSDIVGKILADYLKVDPIKFKGYFNQSYGLKSIVIPDLSPLDAIQWCTNRAVDENQSPDFVFFENVVGYNFTTLSKLLQATEVLDIKFQAKNLNSLETIDEMSGARHFEVISTPDLTRRTREGVVSGTFQMFDPMTRSIGPNYNKTVNYGDHFYTMKHGNGTESPLLSNLINRDGTPNIESYEAKRSFGISAANRKLSKYISSKYPASVMKEEDTENFVFQRKAIIENLISKRLKIVMPGNFQLSSGFNVNVQSRVFGRPKASEDETVNGKYIITASRHILKSIGKFETIIETATTSSGIDYVPTSSNIDASDVYSYDEIY